MNSQIPQGNELSHRLVNPSYAKGTPKICPDLLGEEHSNPGFLFQRVTIHFLFFPARIMG